MDTGRHCMSDRIREALALQIYEGQLQPGDRLVELDLARQFDTSQTPVREALRELESLRLVESQPYRGTRVRAVSPREMAEAYAVRGVLEQLAAELAAPRFEPHLASLRQSVKLLIEAAAQGDGHSYATHNFAFHLLIVEAADNQVLLQTWQSLAFETRMRLSVARSSADDIVRRLDIHEEILQALAVGDGITAGRLLREHSESIAAIWHQRCEQAAPGAPADDGEALSHTPDERDSPLERNSG